MQGPTREEELMEKSRCTLSSAITCASSATATRQPMLKRVDGEEMQKPNKKLSSTSILLLPPLPLLATRSERGTCCESCFSSRFLVQKLSHDPASAPLSLEPRQQHKQCRRKKDRKLLCITDSRWEKRPSSIVVGVCMISLSRVKLLKPQEQRQQSLISPKQAVVRQQTEALAYKGLHLISGLRL